MPHTPDMDECYASESVEIDVDEAEGSDSEEEDPEDFWRGIDNSDLGTMVSVEGEEVGEDGEMQNNFASVRNSVGFEVPVEPVPIMRELEPSLNESRHNDSVSTIIGFGIKIKIYLPYLINRTIKLLNAAVKMKASMPVWESRVK
jgi:hypothetical protein